MNVEFYIACRVANNFQIFIDDSLGKVSCFLRYDNRSSYIHINLIELVIN